MLKIKWLFLVNLSFVTLSAFGQPALPANQEQRSFTIPSSHFSSWNHITLTDETYSALAHPSSKYQLEQLKHSPNESISYGIVLVKKLLNWQQQHSNGVEVRLDRPALKFSQLNNLHFNLKFDTKNSVLNTDTKALTADNPWLKPYEESLTGLVSKQANFMITFYGEHHSHPELNTAYASFTFSISPKTKNDDDGQTITITPNKLSYYWQQNYEEQTATLAELNNVAIKGFILVAESGNTKVARSSLNENFPDDYSEAFNELAIELSGFTLEYSTK